MEFLRLQVVEQQNIIDDLTKVRLGLGSTVRVHVIAAEQPARLKFSMLESLFAENVCFLRL